MKDVSYIGDTGTISVLELHQYEVNLIKICRNIGFGRANIILQNGLPIRIEEAVRFHNSTLDTKI